ncbi:MAG: VWA domain-containing protein [Alphaproteobacteria bacterium]
MSIRNLLRAWGAIFFAFLVSVSPVRAMPFHDVVIMLDNSGSLGSANFLAQRQAAINLDTDYGGQPLNPMRFAVIDFATNVSVIHGFDDSQNQNDVLASLTGLSYTGGYTNTGGALSEMMNQFDVFSGAPNSMTAILFTDGQPYGPTGPEGVCHLEAPIKSRGISVNIVGHGARWVNQDGQAKTQCLVIDPVTDILSKESPLQYNIEDYEYLSSTTILAMAEPGTLAVLGLGLVAIGYSRRRVA